MSGTSLVELIHARLGIEPREDAALAAHVRARMTALRLSREDAYVDRLVSERVGGREWALLVDVITNPLTCFFRDAVQFDAIADLLVERAREVRGRPLFLWSAGCSTGEEPYTLSMLCAELGVDARVLGTDINPRALARAHDAVYGAWTLRHLGAERRRRHFRERGVTFEVTSEVRQRVELRPHNLVVDPTPSSEGPGGGWDLVMCRNVLIYYSRTDSEHLTRKLASALVPEGALVLGATESHVGMRVELPVMQRCGVVLYRPAGSSAGEDLLRSLRPPSPRLVSSPPPSSPPPSSPRARLDDVGSTEVRDAIAWGPVSPPTEAVAPPPLVEVAAAVAPDAVGAGLAAEEARLLPLLEQRRLPEARRVVEEVLARAADDPLAAFVLGAICLALHELDAALEAFARARAAEALSIEVPYLEGLTLAKQQRWEEAYAAYQRAVFLAPDFWAAIYFLALTARRLGREQVWRRELSRARKVLEEGTGRVPQLYHPVFCVEFIPPPQQVLARCRRDVGV